MFNAEAKQKTIVKQREVMEKHITAKMEWVIAEAMWEKMYAIAAIARAFGTPQEAAWAIVRFTDKAAAQTRKAAWAITHAEWAKDSEDEEEETK